MASEEKDTVEKDKGKKGGKSKMGLILVLFAVLLMLGGGGFIAYKMVLVPILEQKTADAQNAAEAVNAEDPLGVTQKKPMEAGVMYDIPAFVVNLADATGTKYLKISLSLELPSTNKNLSPEIESRLPKIKDTIITVLSAKTLEEVSTPQGKVSLKQELLRRINSVLASGKVMEIYVTDFVVQG